jgi:diguanylate cyclase (GGDEF)-like protein/PAS domain S-box-containing protein
VSTDNSMTREQLVRELVSLRRRQISLERRLAAEKIVRSSEARYRAIFESAAEGILVVDADSGLISEANPAFLALSGFLWQELAGRRLGEIGLFRKLEARRREDHGKAAGDPAGQEELHWTAKDGRPLRVEFSVALHPIGGRRVVQFRLRDVTERWNTERMLQYVTTHDERTGLHNRMFFDEEISRLGRGRHFPITVVLADVDGLKRANGTAGHAAGDQLLKVAAAVLRESFRADEVVARMGGDEFAVLLPRTDEAAAESALRRIRQRQDDFNNSGRGLLLGFALGAGTAETSLQLTEALARAGERLCADRAARSPHLLFLQIAEKLSSNPGMRMSVLASEIACERHVIERAVKAVKSMPFREYQQTVKLERAMQLLSERPLLIKQVAGALGYASPASLWRLLKKRTRTRPIDIRNTRGRT